MITKNISNHPVINSITRTATFVDLTWNPCKNEAFVGLLINHYINGISIPQLDKRIQTIQDNTTQIPVDPTNPEGETKGDYDIFAQRVEAGESFVTIVQDGIMLADIIGKINEKMNY